MSPQNVQTVRWKGNCLKIKSRSLRFYGAQHVCCWSTITLSWAWFLTDVTAKCMITGLNGSSGPESWKRPLTRLSISTQGIFDSCLVACQYAGFHHRPQANAFLQFHACWMTGIWTIDDRAFNGKTQFSNDSIRFLITNKEFELPWLFLYRQSALA